MVRAILHDKFQSNNCVHIYIQRESLGLIRKQATNMKPNAKLMLFRLKPWSSAAGGSLHITVQCMCKQTVTRVTANTDDAMRRPRDARGGGAAMWTRRTSVLHRTSSKMERSISSNPGSFPVWPTRGPGLQGHDLCAHTHWRHSRGPTPAASLATCPPHAGRSLAGLVACLCMQDAPWQAWSHAIACRTLPGASLVACHCMQDAPAIVCRALPRSTLLGHMPVHTGRSRSHAKRAHTKTSCKHESFC